MRHGALYQLWHPATLLHCRPETPRGHGCPSAVGCSGARVMEHLKRAPIWHPKRIYDKLHDEGLGVAR